MRRTGDHQLAGPADEGAVSAERRHAISKSSHAGVSHRLQLAGSFGNVCSGKLPSRA